MSALIKSASKLSSSEFLEDAVGLAAICVIILAGLSLPAVI